MGASARKIETAPEPNLLSISEIAKRVRLDRATVSSRLDELGYEPHDSSTAKLKLYPFDDEMEFAVKSAKDSLSAMKIRQLRAAAEKIEMQNAQSRGELVSMQEATEMVQKIVVKIYQEFTVQQPKRLAPKLAKAKNVAGVRKVLKADTDMIMKNLRQNFERFID